MTALLQRVELSTEFKTKKTFYVWVRASSSDERPETKKKSDAKKGSFGAAKIVILSPAGIRSIYPTTFK